MPIIFVFTPFVRVIALYVIAAVLPAALLMRYIYRKDPFEKEPRRLLASLLFLGVAAALVSMGLEWLGASLLPGIVSNASKYYTAVFAFLVIAVAEEGAKFLFLAIRTWHSRDFNRRFDGIVYAVFVSLGFAAFENILYVFGYGLSVALPRALTAIPAHMSFGVFMGMFYGRARAHSTRGRRTAQTFSLLIAFFIPMFLHGLYDTAAMTGTRLTTILFFVFAAVTYISVFFLIKKEAKTDRNILTSSVIEV